jgi:GNAT superfamily N-acetyltransferase
VSAAYYGAADRSTMLTATYREAQESDIPAMARIRAGEWETEEYWRNRIAAYLACELHPQHALKPRVSYVAYEGTSLVGFIAGHLTRRHSCDGELEWINVVPQRRGSGVAPGLLRLLAGWFVRQKALRICVDVQPKNITARCFYKRHGARDLNPHWLVWDDISTMLAEPSHLVPGP